MTFDIRRANREELPATMTVFHSAMLAVSAERVRTAIEDERALVATVNDRILGALVVGPGGADCVSIDAIAVRRRRRGQRIGTALVQAAAERHGALVAEFDEEVRPFWESLGFDVEPAAEQGRYVGRFDTDPERSY